MLTEEVEELPAKAVDQFPTVFTARSRASNLWKASRWLSIAPQYLQELMSDTNKIRSSTTRRNPGICVRRLHRKTLSGRSSKCSEWKYVMFTAMEEEFRRLRALGVKLTRKLICEMEIHLVDDPDVYVTAAQIKNLTGRNLVDVITLGWVQSFLDTHRIVTRRRTVKKSFSVEAELEMEQTMAYLLGTLKRNYDDGLDCRCVENYDECHFLYDPDDGRCLAFVGTSRITFAQIASAGKGFTVCLRVSGGVDCKIEVPLVIFQNESESYPIAVLPDTVNGIAYRPQRKGWMTQSLFAEYFCEPRVIPCLSNELSRHLWVDRCLLHSPTARLQQALESTRTVVHRFPANYTNKIQPLDQLVFRSFKANWRQKWNQKRMELVRNNEMTSSGRIVNPGKRFYLELTKEVVGETNNQMTQSGLSVARNL